MFKIIDNFLSKEEFESIDEIIRNESFGWGLSTYLNSNSKPGDFQFSHMLVEKGQVCSNLIKIVDILCKKIPNGTPNMKIIRAKVNMFLKTETNNQLGFHQDMISDNNCKTLLFYLEDSNGYTEFKNGEIIKSVKNRAAMFDSQEFHQTVTATDVMFRRNININYTI